MLSQVNGMYRAIPNKNLAVLVLFFFSSKGETSLGIENFFFVCSGDRVICLGSLHGGEAG